MADSRLADIYRKELKTKGLLGALVSASGARLKEKTDIRGMLPQTGVSGAAFEKMFGKRYKYGGDKQSIRSSGGSDSGVSKSMEEKLTRIGVDGKLTAKNTVVLPAMARDMNLMRMNMQKMVKLSGGTPSTKADMFFKRASDREAQYEGQYKKNSGGLTPTPVGEKKTSGGGIFDFIKSILNTNLTSILSGLFDGLLKAGLLVGIFAAIGKYFEGGEFKTSVDNMLNSIFSTIFGENYKKNIWDGVKILGGAILAIKAGFVIFELAIAAAARKMWAFAAGAPGGGPGGAGGKKGGKFGAVGKFGLLLGAGLTAAQIYEMFGGKEQAEAALGEKFEGGESPNAPGAAPTSESVPQTSTAEKVGTAANIGLQTAFAASLIKPLPGGAISTPTTSPTTSPTAGGKPLTSFGTVGENREMAKNKDLWKKIVDVITKAVQKGASTNMITKFASKFGYFAAAKFAAVVAGVAAAPFSAGLSLLISAFGALLLVYDIYQIYEFFVDLEKEMSEDEKNSAIVREESAPAITPPSTATQVPGGAVTSNSGGAATSVSRTPTRNAGGGRGFINPTSPSAASGDSRTAIEDYLGRKISDEEHDMLMRAVYAEASANKDEYANVMAVILNRTRKTGGTIIDTLTERNQFQAVTGTANNPGPSANFKRGPNEKSIAMINEGASSLSGISKNLDAFTAANRNAYGAGTNVAWLDKLQASGGKQIGQTVFAENMYRGGGGGKGDTTPAAATALASAPNTGNALLDIFAGYSQYRDEFMKQSGGNTTNVNAPVTNVAQNSGGGGGGSVNPYNTDMMKYLLRPIA